MNTNSMHILVHHMDTEDFEDTFQARRQGLRPACTHPSADRKISPISPPDHPHYAHTVPSRITTELWELPVLFTGGVRNNFAYD